MHSARDLAALNLIAELKGQGHFVLVVGGQLGVCPDDDLTPEQRAKIADLTPEIKARVEAGDDGEFLDVVDLAPELADWYAGLHPIMQQAVMHCARMHQKLFGSTLADAFRASAEPREQWGEVGGAAGRG